MRDMAIKAEQAVLANEIVVYKPIGRNGNCRGFLGSSKRWPADGFAPC